MGRTQTSQVVSIFLSDAGGFGPPQNRSRLSERVARYGWLMAVLAALPALVIPLLPGWADRLQFSPTAFASGEVWRIWTSHWTHWSTDHLLWDVTVFVLLFGMAWRSSPKKTLVALGVSATLIPLVVLVKRPDLIAYRGLSGIDSALFLQVAVTTFRRAFVRRDGAGMGWAIVWMTLFAAKAVWEQVTGATFFADGVGYLPVPEAHVAGALVGLAVGATINAGRSTLERSRYRSPDRQEPCQSPHPVLDRPPSLRARG